MFKKIKIFILSSMILLVTGCVGAIIEININNDNSGTFSVVMGYSEEYLKSIEENEEFEINQDNEIEFPFDDATKEDVEFIKNGKKYIGKKAVMSFNSLEELEDLFNQVLENGDNQNSNKLTISKNENEITIKLNKNNESYEQSKMMLAYMDYTIIIKVEGDIIQQNATTYDDNSKTMEWDIEDVLKKGIDLKYSNDSDSRVEDDLKTKEFNLLYFAPLAVVALLSISTIYIYVVRGPKKNS